MTRPLRKRLSLWDTETEQWVDRDKLFWRVDLAGDTFRVPAFVLDIDGYVWHVKSWNISSDKISVELNLEVTDRYVWAEEGSRNTVKNHPRK